MVRLPIASRALRLLALLAALALGSVATLAQAPQPSEELKALQEQARRSYQARAYSEALGLYQRVLDMVLAEFGPESEQTAIAYYSLGLVAEAAGDYAASERFHRRSVFLREKIYGPDSAGVAMALESLGQALMKAGHLDEAEPQFRRALTIRQAAVGSQHAFSAAGHANLGHVALARGRWQEALAAYRQATRLVAGQDTSTVTVKALVEDEIRRYRDAFVGLARATWELRETPGGAPQAAFEETFAAAQQAWSTEAASALAKMTARLGAGQTELGRRIRAVQDLSDRALELGREAQELLAGWSAVQRANREFMGLQETFRAQSIARARDQAPLVRQQTALVEELKEILARCPPGGQRGPSCATADARRGAIAAELGRLSQQASQGSGELMAVHARMEAAEKRLPGYAEFQARHSAVSEALHRAERDVREARAEVVRAFPDYAELSDPRPMTRQQVQSLLRPDEVLVAYLVGSQRSFVWALTRERAEWSMIEPGAEELAREVAHLRRGLDPQAQQDAAGTEGSRAGVTTGFDLARSHALYDKVLGPVSGMLTGKRHLIVVPGGALTSMPFQVLVKAPPRPARTPQEAYRSARWLISSHAISVLPSVPSLGALRKITAGSVAPRPFFGMGDPVLVGPDPTERQRGAAKRVGPPARYYRNGLADTRAVRQLQPLPETADELRAIAKSLGARPEDVNLREAASETRLKGTALADYRIIEFATHGLVAGDLSGLAEPALVLTPPDTPTETDDGLLTASEIAALRLDADWVVLSACNTAAGETEGADALSGLARAFFYAGARTLLVSHWSVYSAAATDLTTATFSRIAKAPKTGRAEAFRQSMLRLIAEGKEPAYWAPFVVVGEGAPLAR
ncbi:MAG: CHAT domain-containing tetratricopeptide repeat protein [Hyphomicrobiaceae bacterium]|nr:CHAT domain-containing tetratricopeptide repeat protein [Hyphomicrobiaceae bacterium]